MEQNHEEDDPYDYNYLLWLRLEQEHIIQS